LQLATVGVAGSRTEVGGATARGALAATEAVEAELASVVADLAGDSIGITPRGMSPGVATSLQALSSHLHNMRALRDFPIAENVAKAKLR